MCQDLIGGDVRLYWDQAVYKKADTKEDFPWHQDNGYTFVNPQAYLTCWIPLTDTDESNGCPWVIPKLHKMGTLKHDVTELGYKIKLDDSDAIPVPAKAGDIVVFSSLTPHCTGPNKTDLTRKSYILQYAPNGAVRYPPFSDKEEANNPDRQFSVSYTQLDPNTILRLHLLSPDTSLEKLYDSQKILRNLNIRPNEW